MVIKQLTLSFCYILWYLQSVAEIDSVSQTWTEKLVSTYKVKRQSTYRWYQLGIDCFFSHWSQFNNIALHTSQTQAILSKE